jgi:4-oxalocrotonate tautomerase
MVDSIQAIGWKAQYVSNAFDALYKLPGNRHEESYIYVQGVRAIAYGYAENTRKYRYQPA